MPAVLALNHLSDPDLGAVVAYLKTIPPVDHETRSGELTGWSDEDFIRVLRIGFTPTGHQLREYMPWPYIDRMTDAELNAIWLYLQSLPTNPVVLQ